MSGAWVTDRTHGLQFKAAFLKAPPLTTLEGIEHYLGSSMIRGIGPIYAKKNPEGPLAPAWRQRRNVHVHINTTNPASFQKKCSAEAVDKHPQSNSCLTFSCQRALIIRPTTL